MSDCEHSGERSVDRATGDEQCQDCGSDNPTTGTGQLAIASRWCPDCGTKNTYELGERWTCRGCGVIWVRGSKTSPTCTMLTGYSSDRGTPDVECGQPATHVAVYDGKHFACALCFAAMSDDAELASEYQKLPLPETSTAERTHFVIEPPGAATMALLRAGLERSGMTFGECVECSRPYGTRNGSELCPSCREPAKYGDDWWLKHPEGSRFTQRARLLALLMHRGSERLAIEELGGHAYESLDSPLLGLVLRALDGDEAAWRASLVADLVRQEPVLDGIMESVKTEVHVEVREIASC